MPEVSNTFVSLVGIGTVFVGLICIIFLCMLMSTLCRTLANLKPAEAPAQQAAVTAAAVAPAAPAAIPNRQEFIAAVSAVLAEDLGTDVSAIRIVSVKKV